MSADPVKRRDKLRVRAFKAEYAAVLNNKQRIDDLYQRLYEIDVWIGANSPSLSGMHYAGKTHDEKMIDYAEKRTPILAEIRRLESEKERVDKILSLMDKRFRNVLEMVTARRKTLQQFGDEFYMSEGNVRYLLDREILHALNLIDESMQA